MSRFQLSIHYQQRVLYDATYYNPLNIPTAHFMMHIFTIISTLLLRLNMAQSKTTHIRLFNEKVVVGVISSLLSYLYDAHYQFLKDTEFSSSQMKADNLAISIFTHDYFAITRLSP